MMDGVDGADGSEWIGGWDGMGWGAKWNWTMEPVPDGYPW